MTERSPRDRGRSTRRRPLPRRARRGNVLYGEPDCIGGHVIRYERAGGLARLELPDGRVVEVAGAHAIVHGPEGVEVELSPVAQEVIAAIVFAFSGGDG